MTDVQQEKKGLHPSVYVTGFHTSPDDKRCKMIYKYKRNLIVCRHSSHETDLLLLDMKLQLGLEVEPHVIRDYVAPIVAIQASTNEKAVQVGEKMFVPTPSGRAAKGELEERVRVKFKAMLSIGQFAVDMLKAHGMTPKNMSLGLDKENPPSEGAIYSIFKRWSEKEYVKLSEKPFQVVEFTDRGRRELDI